MDKEWETSFEMWAQGPAKTEQDKCDNAESSVRNAITAYPPFRTRDLRVFAQGSYRARTNIRQDSDVDLCVCLKTPYFAEYPTGKDATFFGNETATYTFGEYKNDVGEALAAYFKNGRITRGRKAFDLHENTYRVDADVVPALELRDYSGIRTVTGEFEYRAGIRFNIDGGGQVTNYPDQTYANGVSKNDRTNRRYKRVVRILKNLRNYMQEKQITEASDIASFMIESMIWNCPDESFDHEAYWQSVREVLVYLWNQTKSGSDISNWCEVNAIKYLFHVSQPWSQEQAHRFVEACWHFLEFK